ncbi:hypothetical protein C7212DRAFT_187535 [Tuber magnatum]|uniref:Clr5 domain-containing protein n=1 Tax=Tuber magnatum TaxID=42249 RepID=A0A317SPS6_9PEZI|nr:hypothetical protein C7212DRAFT_187535 [Tuber magnatum]
MTKAWGKHKKLLRELYIERKIKLKQVMEIMAKNHDFVACRRTYMKMFGRWGYQKNRKSQTARREGCSSRERSTQLCSAAQEPREGLDVTSDTQLNAHETNGYNPTYKINKAIIGPIVNDQAIGGASSPLDNFRDSDDLNKYLAELEGALLLNEIKRKAQVSGNPDPHSPVMSGYQQALGGIFSGDTPVVKGDQAEQY